LKPPQGVALEPMVWKLISKNYTSWATDDVNRVILRPLVMRQYRAAYDKQADGWTDKRNAAV